MKNLGILHRDLSVKFEPVLITKCIAETPVEKGL
jgi:hypothetical protein